MTHMSQNSDVTAAGRVIPIVILGHVDHGKSTLIGRLLNDTGSLPEGRADEVRASCARRGVAFEWSFVMDALQVERDQGITLDTTRIWFKSDRRSYVIIDAPGHKEFLRNMVTGAAGAHAAVLVVDAAKGVSEQTRRHAVLASLLGIRDLVVAVNKMDLVGWDAKAFETVKTEVEGYLKTIGSTARAVVPISARSGLYLANRDGESPEDRVGAEWYDGPSLLEALDAMPVPAARQDLFLRLPVQDVYRREDKRIIVGRIEAGTLRLGDLIRVQPNDELARVASFERWDGPGAPELPPQTEASAGEPVAITLDKDLFVERGNLIVPSLEDRASGADYRRRLTVRLFWLDREPLEPGARLRLKTGTKEHPVIVSRIAGALDLETLEPKAARALEPGGIGDVVLDAREPVLMDLEPGYGATRRGVLVSGHRQVGGVLFQQDERSRIQAETRNLTAPDESVLPADRRGTNGHGGGVIWMTGLSGAGKSTVAMTVQRRLFEQGWQVTVLDGDRLRQGLTKHLGFAPEDRAENIRLAAETAKLIAESGMLVIAAFVSPYLADRAAARDIVGEDFREIHIAADLATCEARDVKGLYAKARAGIIPSFTGISDPYEPPENAELVVETGGLPITASADRLEAFIHKEFGGGHSWFWEI
ncbi:MAG: adenylyl-sulfate kinase [Rhodospirillaceae bacterium]